jgi:arginine-tRNA-protein transferase
MDAPISSTTRSGLPLPQLSPPPALVTLPAEECPYLPGLVSQYRAFAAAQIDPEAYHELMNAGFRRSGRMVYQPICGGCAACVPIRVPVENFEASKSQRRCFRRNADLKITVGKPQASDEKFSLYQRYRADWHATTEPARGAEREGFESFLYESPVRSIEFVYRLPTDEIVGVGICDVCSESLSSVYFYFDPAQAKRGLGTFSALFEIDYARQARIPYWYAGFHVAGCAAMEYKAAFRPHQFLGADGVWR